MNIEPVGKKYADRELYGRAPHERTCYMKIMYYGIIPLKKIYETLVML